MTLNFACAEGKERMSNRPETLYDKIFNSHVVSWQNDNETAIIYIDRHLVHEVTSPQAFEGLSNASRNVRRRDLTLCTVDHNIPTDPRVGAEDLSSFIKE
jgi:3-isopropylmalate dehydratase